jgi:hypothetical protein
MIESESNNQAVQPPAETPAERAQRLISKLAGLLKDELAEYGGGEAFIRWVRGYDEDDAFLRDRDVPRNWFSGAVLRSI